MAKEKTAVKAKKVRLDASDKIVRGFAYVFISLFAALCLFPFLLIVATSFSSEKSIMQYGFQIWPREFSLYAYQLIFKTPMVMIKTYGLTIGLTVAGTIIGLFIVAMTGYALCRPDFPFRNGISFYIYFTTLFSGGLVPFYLLVVKYLHLKDSYFAILLPLLMSPWLIILMKNFVKGIPFEITESEKIDGANDFKIFTSLILPMMTPGLATIGLFIALGYWNEWYYSSLFLSSKVDVRPLQYQLYRIINEVNSLKNSVAGANIVVTDLPDESLKMATAVLATGPIIFLYPSVQKYFISGITVGAVKG